MKEKEFTRLKFQICSDASNESIFNWEESDEKVISTKWGIDLKNFKKILDKHDLEDYYKLLLGYLSGEKHLLSLMSKNNPEPEGKIDEYNERRDNLLELAKMLRFLLDDSKGRFNYLKINKEKADSIETKNDSVLKSVQESLAERIEMDFRKLNGHIDPLTDEEATKQLKEGKDPGWLMFWNNSRHYTDKDGKRLISISLDINDDTVLKYADSNELTTGAEVKQLLINEYAYDHEIEHELTQEYLIKLIDRYSLPKNSRGGQEKHYQAKRIMQVLTNVFWTEYFFFKGNSGKTSCPTKLSNKHYHFFYDIFVTWGLFDDFQITIPGDYDVKKKLRELFSPATEVFWKELSPGLLDLESRL